MGERDVTNRCRAHFLGPRSPWEEYPGVTADSARWEQAFSADGGATRVTNRTMEFTRRA